LEFSEHVFKLLLGVGTEELLGGLVTQPFHQFLDHALDRLELRTEELIILPLATAFFPAVII
jgi:hypothetical protein